MQHATVLEFKARPRRRTVRRGQVAGTATPYVPLVHHACAVPDAEFDRSEGRPVLGMPDGGTVLPFGRPGSARAPRGFEDPLPPTA